MLKSQLSPTLYGRRRPSPLWLVWFLCKGCLLCCVGLFSASCANPSASGIAVRGRWGVRISAFFPAVPVSEVGQDKEKPAPLLTSLYFGELLNCFDVIFLIYKIGKGADNTWGVFVRTVGVHGCVWCVKHLAQNLVCSEHLLNVSYSPLALVVISHMWRIIGKIQDFLLINIALVLA